MSQLTSLKVFLASPSDVTTERASVQAIIDEVNRTTGIATGVVLQLFISKHAVPGYGPDGQAIVNKRAGPMSKYTLFIGIMWNRIGRATPRARSGTVEEFNRAVEARERTGQPDIWFFFRESAFHHKTPLEAHQREQVLKFKEQIQTKALTKEYRSPSDFRDQLREYLITWLHQRHSKSLPKPRTVKQRTKNEVAPKPQIKVVKPSTPASGMQQPSQKRPRPPAKMKDLSTIVCKNPAGWIMLHDYFFQSESIAVQTDQKIVLKIAPTTLEDVDRIKMLQPGTLLGRRQVAYADQQHAGLTTVISVTSETRESQITFTITVAPTATFQGNSMQGEFSYNNYSADDIAKLCAQRILLGQPLPKQVEHLSSVYSRPNSLHEATHLTADTLSRLWVILGSNPQSFLSHAWLYAAYLLKSSNIIESIHTLELGPIKSKAMQIRFCGRRRQQYPNQEPTIIEVIGKCSLEP